MPDGNNYMNLTDQEGGTTCCQCPQCPKLLSFGGPYYPQVDNMCYGCVKSSFFYAEYPLKIWTQLLKFPKFFIKYINVVTVLAEKIEEI